MPTPLIPGGQPPQQVGAPTIPSVRTATPRPVVPPPSCATRTPAVPLPSPGKSLLSSSADVPGSLAATVVPGEADASVSAVTADTALKVVNITLPFGIGDSMISGSGTRRTILGLWKEPDGSVEIQFEVVKRFKAEDLDNEFHTGDDEPIPLATLSETIKIGDMLYGVGVKGVTFHVSGLSRSTDGALTSVVFRYVSPEPADQNFSHIVGIERGKEES